MIVYLLQHTINKAFWQCGSLASLSVILSPQNHFDFAHFDGQNNFATFTRMKLTTNISKPLFIAVRWH